MIVYHATDSASAERIMRDGFRDEAWTYKNVGMDLSGVFVTDSRAFAHDDGDPADVAVLALDVPENALATFEIIEDVRDFRKWCAPADLLNAYRRTRLEARSH